MPSCFNTDSLSGPGWKLASGPSLGRRELMKSAAGLLAVVGSGPLAAASRRTGGNLAVTSGLLEVTQDMVVDGVLTIDPGAGISLAADTTLHVLGDFIAPATQVFFGQGKVDFTRSNVIAARPEWWGARHNAPELDCQPALSAALESHISVALGPGDYFLGRTLRVDRSNRRLWGVGRTKDGHGTRLVLRGGRGTVVLLGTETAPRIINEYVRGIDLRYLEFGRTEAPDDGGEGEDQPVGLRIRHVLDANCEGLRANEHSVGYDLRGAVRSYLRDCVAFRSLAGPVPGQGGFIGFRMDGRDPPIPTGANASLYLIDCNASLGGRPPLAGSAGCRIDGAMSDTFIVRFETTSLDHGIIIDGGSGSLLPSQSRYAQIDVHIDTPVLDQCRVGGITLAGMADNALVNVRSPYVGLGDGGSAAISIRQSGGAVEITGGQLVAPAGNREATGLLLEAVSGLAIEGTRLSGMARPVMADRLVSASLDVAIGAVGEDWRAPAITVTRSHHLYIKPRFFGTRGRYSSGVQLDRECDEITIEAASLDPAALAGSVVTGARREPVRVGSAYRIGGSGD